MDKIKYLRLIKYPGSKYNYLDKLNSIFNNYEFNTFIDTFGGSAAVSLNVQSDKIVFNDIDNNIHIILNSFKYGSFENLKELYTYIEKNYKNINLKNDHSKEEYYNCRNYFNAKYLHKDNIMLGFFYFIISAAAINSMFRVGPNGFNQGYGYTKIRIIDENEFNLIKNKILNLNIHKLDYQELLNLYNTDENILWFLDPPYNLKLKNSTTYKSNNFHEDEFFNFIKKIKGNIIYTDYYDESKLEKLNKIRKFNYKILREMKSLAPSKSKKETEFLECIYYT